MTSLFYWNLFLYFKPFSLSNLDLTTRNRGLISKLSLLFTGKIVKEPGYAFCAQEVICLKLMSMLMAM
jgi:hypothetical protein